MLDPALDPDAVLDPDAALDPDAELAPELDCSAELDRDEWPPLCAELRPELDETVVASWAPASPPPPGVPPPLEPEQPAARALTVTIAKTTTAARIMLGTP
jgi:hypothetical protein